MLDDGCRVIAPRHIRGKCFDGIIVYTEVITERVQAEEALRKSEQRHRILFEEALNPILLVDENGHYIDANETALQFMECDREKLIGRSVWEFAPPGIIERQKREHSPFAESRTLETDYLINGRVKTLLLNVVSLEAGGRTVLCGIGQDITERKQAEESLIRQQRFIKLSSRRIANVFLTSPRDEVFADVLDVILKALDSRFGYFGYIDKAGDLVCPSLTRDVWEQCQVPEKSVVFRRSSWGGLWGRSLMEQQTLIANENLQIPEGHVTLENDVVMPEMNGRELAENLSSHFPNLKRLFMSGYTANVIAHHAVLDEGVHFIQKPFSMKDLGGKLREALKS